MRLFRIDNILAFAFILSSAAGAAGQSGGIFKLDQTVVAGGGNTVSEDAFAVESTSGQSTAGGALRGSQFAVTSGFWNFAPLAPTSAGVSVGGRVTSYAGTGIPRAIVSITNSSGETRSALTSPFGYFRLTDVPAGDTYILIISHKGFLFVPQALTVTEDITGLSITALP